MLGASVPLGAVVTVPAESQRGRAAVPRESSGEAGRDFRRNHGIFRRRVAGDAGPPAFARRRRFRLDTLPGTRRQHGDVSPLGCDEHALEPADALNDELFSEVQKAHLV